MALVLFRSKIFNFESIACLFSFTEGFRLFFIGIRSLTTYSICDENSRTDELYLSIQYTHNRSTIIQSVASWN